MVTAIGSQLPGWETRQFEHQGRFLEVVESVQRLPSPASVPPNESDLQIFHHWI